MSTAAFEPLDYLPPFTFGSYNNCCIIFTKRGDGSTGWFIMGDDWTESGVSRDIDVATQRVRDLINHRIRLQ